MKLELTATEILSWPFIVDQTGHARVMFLGAGVARSRLVVWANSGRLLDARKEVVHHVNENKLDDRPENLVVLTRSDHMKLHNQKQPWIGRGWPKGKPRGEEYGRKESTARMGKRPWNYSLNDLSIEQQAELDRQHRAKLSASGKMGWIKRRKNRRAILEQARSDGLPN